MPHDYGHIPTVGSAEGDTELGAVIGARNSDHLRADHVLGDNLNAECIEFGSKKERIGIEAIRSQHLRTDRDDLRVMHFL